MKSLILAIALLFALAAPILAAQGDPCAELELGEDEVGLAYQGHCIGVQEDGPTVQPVIVRVTSGLTGVESVMGILVVRTASGWVVAEPEFYEDRGVAGVAIGDEDFAITKAR
jgi:hypothetical protein